MTHTELIEQIRQGAPLENDIDDVILLNKVLTECFGIESGKAEGGYRYYYKHVFGWSCSHVYMTNAIKLSAFKTKMVSVEDVKDFFFYKANLEDNNWVRFKHQDITTFLNSKGI